MNHAMRMRHEQATCGLNEDRQQLRRLHRAVDLVEQIGQRLARHILHNQESDAVMLVVFKQCGDVWMRQIGGIMGLCA